MSTIYNKYKPTEPTCLSFRFSSTGPAVYTLAQVLLSHLAISGQSFLTAADQAARLALTGLTAGELVTQEDENIIYRLDDPDSPAVNGSWTPVSIVVADGTARAAATPDTGMVLFQEDDWSWWREFGGVWAEGSPRALSGIGTDVAGLATRLYTSVELRANSAAGSATIYAWTPPTSPDNVLTFPTITNNQVKEYGTVLADISTGYPSVLRNVDPGSVLLYANGDMVMEVQAWVN